MLAVTFDIDPSVSKIENEHIKLAEYMKERLLSVDIYDSDTKFLYACARIPMFELLRQQRPFAMATKDCEACAPDTTNMRGNITIIMTNQGKNEQALLIPHSSSSPERGATFDDMQRPKTGIQPSQRITKAGDHFKKVVRSRPLDLTRTQAS